MARSRRVAGLAAVILGLALPAAGATDAGQRCAGAKRARAGRLAQALVRCEAQVVRRAPRSEPACTTSARDRFAGSWEHLEAAGGCATAGDGPLVERIVETFASSLADRLVPAARPSACTMRKLAAAGGAA